VEDFIILGERTYRYEHGHYKENGKSGIDYWGVNNWELQDIGRCIEMTMIKDSPYLLHCLESRFLGFFLVDFH